METLSLEKIKQVEFSILRHFAAFCRAQGLSFYLSNGTLLGAVKYGGFIPWDDDIDVLMPREDYDRLMVLYEDSGAYVLLSSGRNPSFAFPFAKLCDMSTRKAEGNTNNGVAVGLDIDIFPLDACPGDREATKKQIKQVRRAMFWLDFAKMRQAQGSNLLKRLAKRCLMAATKLAGGPMHYVRKIQAIAAQGAECPGEKCLGNMVWPIYGEREVLQSQWFTSCVEVSFEGESFPAPAGFDAYLRSLYGDYPQDPPPEQQKTHHVFEAWRI